MFVVATEPRVFATQRCVQEGFQERFSGLDGGFGQAAKTK